MMNATNSRAETEAGTAGEAPTTRARPTTTSTAGQQVPPTVGTTDPAAGRRRGPRGRSPPGRAA